MTSSDAKVQKIFDIWTNLSNLFHYARMQISCNYFLFIAYW
jgi:hypothetical protein